METVTRTQARDLAVSYQAYCEWLHEHYKDQADEKVRFRLSVWANLLMRLQKETGIELAPHVSNHV